MAHYLYVLQSVTLNHLEPRMRTPLDCYSQVSYNIISHSHLSDYYTYTCTFYKDLDIRYFILHTTKDSSAVFI